MKRLTAILIFSSLILSFAPGISGAQTTQTAALAETSASISAAAPATAASGATSATIVRNGVPIPLRPEMLTYKPLKLTVPSVTETTLSNGMRLFAYESHDLPRVYFTVLVRAGKLLDPADKLGLAETTVNTLRSGGTATKSGDDIDRELEQIGSELEVSAERDYIRIQMFALAEKREQALGILSDLLLHPAFDEKKLAQQKELEIEDLRRENDQPSQIARREFRKLIYGAENPMARTPRPEHIGAIARADVEKFYQDYYRPSSVWLGISGDVSLSDAQKLAETSFGAWNRPPAELPPPPVVDETRDTSPSVAVIHRETAQAQFRIGHLGAPRHIPEEYAITVLNGIYGTGGFGSRLMSEVRTKRGFAYGVGGGVWTDTARGLFVAAGSSKSQTTVAAVDTILSITKELLAGNINDDELEVAKRDAIYSFVTGFDTPREIVYSYMNYDLLGYPRDYLQTYVDRIREVTKEQTVDAARKFIHPDRLKVLIVGNETALDKPLSTLGSVQEIKLQPFTAPGSNPPSGQ